MKYCSRRFPCGLVVRIRRSHRRGRGSIPRMGVFFSHSTIFFFCILSKVRFVSLYIHTLPPKYIFIPSLSDYFAYLTSMANPFMNPPPRLCLMRYTPSSALCSSASAKFLVICGWYHLENYNLKCQCTHYCFGYQHYAILMSSL